MFAFIVSMTLTVSMPAYAGEWKQDTTGMWYQNDDGSYPANQWQEVDGRQYYFGGDGYIMINAITPDGSLVDGNGALLSGGYFRSSIAGTGKGGAAGTERAWLPPV